jgi:hypothetical protein
MKKNKEEIKIKWKKNKHSLYLIDQDRPGIWLRLFASVENRIRLMSQTMLRIVCILFF